MASIRHILSRNTVNFEEPVREETSDCQEDTPSEPVCVSCGQPASPYNAPHKLCSVCRDVYVQVIKTVPMDVLGQLLTLVNLLEQIEHQLFTLEHTAGTIGVDHPLSNLRRQTEQILSNPQPLALTQAAASHRDLEDCLKELFMCIFDGCLGINDDGLAEFFRRLYSLHPVVCEIITSSTDNIRGHVVIAGDDLIREANDSKMAGLLNQHVSYTFDISQLSVLARPGCILEEPFRVEKHDG